MNIEQKLLFARVGFSPRTILMLHEHCEDKPITKRTAQYWANGEKEPKNPYYIETAYRLDEHLTEIAIITNHYAKQKELNKIILPYYQDDNEYWTATDDIPCPVSVYHQLLQRIIIISSIPVHLLTNPQNGMEDKALRQDWNSYMNLSVGFDF